MIRPDYYIVDRTNHIATQPNKPIEKGSALESLKAINENFATVQQSNSPERIREAVGNIFIRYNTKYTEKVTGWRSWFAWGSMYQRAQVAKVASEILARVPVAGSKEAAGGFLGAATRLREKKEGEAAAQARTEARVEKHAKGLWSGVVDWFSGTESVKETGEEPALLTHKELEAQKRAKEAKPSQPQSTGGTREFRDVSAQLRERKEAEAKTSIWSSLFGWGKSGKSEKKD